MGQVTAAGSERLEVRSRLSQGELVAKVIQEDQNGLEGRVLAFNIDADDVAMGDEADIIDCVMAANARVRRRTTGIDVAAPRPTVSVGLVKA